MKGTTYHGLISAVLRFWVPILVLAGAIAATVVIFYHNANPKTAVNKTTTITNQAFDQKITTPGFYASFPGVVTAIDPHRLTIRQAIVTSTGPSQKDYSVLTSADTRYGPRPADNGSTQKREDLKVGDSVMVYADPNENVARVTTFTALRIVQQ